MLATGIILMQILEKESVFDKGAVKVHMGHCAWYWTGAQEGETDPGYVGGITDIYPKASRL